MNFYSPYENMIAAAKELPEDKNVKLFMRHSIRFDNPVDGDYSKLLLTPEGIELAYKIGNSIDREVGLIRSSRVERCQQTAKELYKGLKDEYKTPESANIIPQKEFGSVLGDPSGKENGGVEWFEYYHYLQIGNLEGTRGVSLEMEASRLLDAIFSQQSQGCKVDICCSHDSHVVILASALFDLKTGMHGDNWCGYTEGIFFWGKREAFTAIWRGEKKEFKNLYL